MAIIITVDNNRTNNTPTFTSDPLLQDESAGTQPTLNPTDDGNDVNVTLSGSTLGGLLSPFNALLNATSLLGQTTLALSLSQKTFAALNDGASSNSDFIKVEVTAGETITDLFFAGANGQPLNGQQVIINGVPLLTYDNLPIYLYSSGDFAIATTGSTLNAVGARVVAAFYLDDSTTNHLTAGVQTVTFEALKHPDPANVDEPINWTDALRVGASGTLSFDFDKLASQSSLWVAVGNSNEAVLISGSSPEVDNTTGKKTNDSDVIHTSQGGLNATIGVNNQLFDIVGESATFTLVTGLQGLVGADAGVLSDYVIDDPTSGGVEQGIEYSGYIPGVTGAGIFISQDQGSPGATKSLDINVFGTNNATEEEGFGYIYSTTTPTKSGDALADDNAVNVATVTVRDNNNVVVATWVAGADPDGNGPLRGSGATVGGVQVTITGNNIDVNNFGIQYTISWTTVAGATMNRFNVVNEAGKWDIGRVDVQRTIPGSTPVGDKLFLEDDAPRLSGTDVMKAVGEDAMTGAAGGDLSTGIPDAGDAKLDEVSYSYSEIASIVTVGTDSPAQTSLTTSFAAGTAVRDINNNIIMSKGETVFWGVSSGVVQGITATNRVVFTITNDTANSEYDVDLKDQIDHLGANNAPLGEEGITTLNLTPAFKITDRDLDPVTLTGNLVKLDVENDVPVQSASTQTERVEEDELSSAAPGAGQPPADGSDGITDNDAFTDEATLTYAELDPIVTSGADEPETWGLVASFAAGTAVRDIDGNALFSKGDAMTWTVVGGVVQAVAGGRTVFTITQNNNGTPNLATDDSWSIDLRDQIDHPNASGDTFAENINITPAFTARDFDGDAVTLTGSAIRLDVENDVPAQSAATHTERVEEDELSSAAPGAGQPPADGSDGITDNDAFTDEATLTYAELDPIVTSGADEPEAWALATSFAPGTAVLDIDGNALFSKGEAMTWAVVGGVVQAVAGGRIVFTVTHNTNGTANVVTDDSFGIDLRDQIDHPNASGDSFAENINLTPAFTARDFDGDAVALTGNAIRLDVENDVPVQTASTHTERVEEDELSSAAPGAGQPPADGSDGITDNDAFTDEATLTYAELDPIVTSGADEPEAWALATSFAPGTAVRDIDGNALFSKGDAMTWAVVGGVVQAVAGGRIVFTITQNTNGTANVVTDDSFAIDLRDQIDHPNASGDSFAENINITPAFTVRDFDGDAVTLTGNAIRLDVENDVPTAKANASVSKEVHEDALATGNTPDSGDAEVKVVSRTYSKNDLNSLANIGADEDLAFSLNTAAAGQAGAIIGTNVVTTGDVAVLSKGVNVTWAAGDTAGSLKGITTVGATVTTIFTLTPSATPGDFVFTLVDQVDHSGAENDQELLAIDLTSAFKAVDFDLDPLTLNPDSIVMNVENDLPIFSGQIASKTLDWTDENSVSDSLKGKVGADEPATYVIDKYTDLAGYTESLSADGKTLSYIKDGKTYFLLELSDTANSGAGGYTFTVKEPPPPQFIEFNFDNLASGNFLWVAVGGTTSGSTSSTGLLVTGSRLNLNSDGTAVSGGKLASDQVNTSQGGAGATIGIDNQMFTPGDSGIFTFVKDYVPLTGVTQATGQDRDEIAYTGYANVNSASLFISQKQGNTKLDLTMSIYEAGTGPNGTNAQVDEEGASYASGGNISGSGNQAVLNKSLTFLDDYAPNLLSVEIRDGNNALVGTWTTDATAANASAVDQIYLSGFKIAGGTYNGVQVTINGNDADINGVDAFYSIKLNAVAGETFNRIELQADTGKFDIGKFVLNEGQDTPDLDLAFSVSIEDKDGDLYRGFDTTFDDFKIKVDGTGANNDPNNVAPTAFSSSYDTAPVTLTSLAMKNPGFVDDSGMGPSIATIDPVLDQSLSRETFGYQPLDYNFL